MRLLLATGLYPPEIGGPATYAKLFEEQLPNYGIEVLVLPFSLVRHMPPIVRHVAYAWLLAQRMRDVDLVLVQDTVSTGFPVAIIAGLAGKKFVVRVPGDYAWEQGTQRFGVKDSLDDFQKRSYGLAVGFLRSIQRFVVIRAHRVIAPSTYLAKVISSWSPRIKRIEVIYNGIELSEALPVARQENLIVSSGRLVPWKGFDELIEVVSAHPEWKLEILGDGPRHRELRDQIQKAGCEERITLRGRVSHAEAREVFASATVFVLNSRYEGLSHTLIEAMSVGTPVVATRAGGNPEVVHDGEDGILIAVGDKMALEGALTHVLSDAGLRRRLGAAASGRAKDFSINKTVEATASLLKSCVSS
ncbi:glycosyltransferase family 4 protein [Candidatus Kaiserbacteria bacterium]|nr:glycosyltransferase family 4 protein [Candidatus Kaiserbacteria bacterium]